MFCNQCGHRNSSGTRFCSSCGSVLAPSSGDDTTATFAHVDVFSDTTPEQLGVMLDDLPERAGMLVVKRGSNAGSRYLLDADVIRVGRHPDNEIFLDDITVSRRHAEVLRDADGRYRMKDVGSLNGTYLNRERVDESPLRSGDELQIGKFKLVFFSRADAVGE